MWIMSTSPWVVYRPLTFHIESHLRAGAIVPHFSLSDTICIRVSYSTEPLCHVGLVQPDQSMSDRVGPPSSLSAIESSIHPPTIRCDCFDETAVNEIGLKSLCC